MDCKRILVVEDDAAIRRGLIDALSFAGYSTLEASEGAAGLAAALESDCDLLLLDLVLPGRDGLAILREIRALHRPLPVIVLTARGSEDDRVRGLALGADDYVVKPFSIKELLARIEAVLRRMPARTPTPMRLAFDGGQADLERHEVSFDDGDRCELSDRERQLLQYLACNAGRAVSRDELLARVWGLNPSGITTRTIDMHIARLREKLRDDKESPRIVLTVRGQGYGGRRKVAMKRLGSIWLIFGLCVALAAGAMARLGGTALTLERAEASARRQAALEENLQLALWRMDSALSALMAEESARPYFTYSPIYPAERAFTNMFAEIGRGDVLIPSPLLTFRSPQIRLHFQYGPDGRLSSPQVPAGNMRDLAEHRYLSPELIEEASRRLAELGKLVTRKDLAAALVVEDPASPEQTNPTLAFGPVSESKSSNEYMMRSRNTRQAQSAPPAEAQLLSARSSLSQGPLQAIWIGPNLLLARRVRVLEGTFLQGCWLDWHVIQRDLMERAIDLVPNARLQAVLTPGEAAPTRMLASLPVRLVSGSIADEPEPRWSPVRLSLWIAWACVAVAAVAVALVLHGALALSERRGTFVSAVTHELRTPLTTFRLYTEMLDEGMVVSPGAQRSYLRTIRTEADRLGHLVENVLSFARLERGRAALGHEVVAPAAFLDRLVPRLRLRASQAGMDFVVGSVDSRDNVRADISVVDQILSNLVDNAVKYAGGAADRRIQLDVAPAGRWLALTLRDYGPGLDRRVIRRLFRPFSKSANEAAQSAPGVGLGLALSRRLARSLGGDLRLEENGPLGASFTLTIPFA